MKKYLHLTHYDYDALSAVIDILTTGDNVWLDSDGFIFLSKGERDKIIETLQSIKMENISYD